jgi:CRISPR-associated protein Csx17
VNEIALPGCTPEPLMSYLKALGVFRLVVEQRDPSAKLSWQNGIAVLHTVLDRDDLTRFFLDEYKPTPIVGPWGARSGFFPGSSESSAREALNSIETASPAMPRLRPFAEMIASVRRVLLRLGFTEKAKDDDKLVLLRECRNELDDHLIPWLDTAYILTEDGRRFPPLLGTGGNEGSGSYVSTFAQAVVSLIVRGQAAGGVGTALFGAFDTQLGGLAVGHFDPGALGGPNGTQGVSGGGGANPWDYLLGIEGSLLFAGAAVRRYGSDAAGKAAYPFCVEPVAVGYASESEVEVGEKTRAELWVPLWNTPTSLGELSRLYAEGRAQLGRRQAKNAVEFALSLSMLGVSRGLTAFVRYAFVMRYGLSYFAAPLGRVPVKLRPDARLLDDPPLVEWIDRFRRATSDKDKTPTRYQSALRNVDRSMFAFANRSEQGNDSAYLQDVLRTVGRAERTLANGLRFSQEKYLRPLAGLSEQWLMHADDNSIEFRLAASLAGMTRKDEVGPIRVFLEEVEVRKYANWSPGSTSAVWSNRPLADNLAAVFGRRQMEAFRKGIVGIPVYSPQFARLEDVIAFLSEETDDDKLCDLLWGMIGVEYPSGQKLPTSEAVNIPFEFGVPRLLVEERCYTANGKYWHLGDTEANAKPDPDVFHLLSSGRKDAVSQCVTRAARRLKSGGLLVNGYRNRATSGRVIEAVSVIPPTRLLAAMLFPLSHADLERIAQSVLSPPETEEFS